MKRSGSIAMNDNKKFKPVDAPRPIALQKLPTLRAATAGAASTSSQPQQQQQQPQPQPSENQPPFGQGVGVANSKPDSVYDPRFKDLWSPD